MKTIKRFGLAVLTLGLLLLPRALHSVQGEMPRDQVSSPEVEKVNRFLNGGEFTRAAQLAGKIENVRHRDAAFQQISVRQAAAGLRQPALDSATRIQDPHHRSAVMTALADRPATLRNDLGVSGSGLLPGEAPGGLSQVFPGMGARGGMVQPDFDALIELITTTIVPESWEELGGPGTLSEYAQGVYVDSVGTLQRVTQLADNSLLSSIRAGSVARGANSNVMQNSALRKVSLNRLEREVQRLWADGKSPTAEMANLAGLHKVHYVLVYPETGDIVLAGPAGPWTSNAEGRTIHQDSRQPVLKLDDLVVLLRNAQQNQGRFGCSINPTQTGLAAAKAYQEEASKKPLHPRQRDAWLEGLRAAVGKQDIEIYGIDPDTRVGRVLVEADYHMKRIGMGLEEGTAGVPGYLDMLAKPKAGEAVPMDVLRWWFTLNYQAVHATENRDAFEIKGPGVRVLSENQLLEENGQQVRTGRSSELNAQFARNFTQNYDALAVKYPVYAELRNIFDLALVTSLIERERLGDQADWPQLHFGPDQPYQVAKYRTPKDVETIMNYRLIEQKHIIAGVSGGVRVDISEALGKGRIKTDEYGLLKADRTAGAPKENLELRQWWWD
ncbi:MAG: DUF1598 domain-containing protein [Pirellulaceae bacterium]